MSTPSPTPREVLERLDSRHDELIQQLDKLCAQIEATLADFVASRESTPPATRLPDAA